MKKIFFTVGPSEVYPTLDKHIQKALEEQILSLSHRGREFQDIYKNAEMKLKKLLKIPEDYAVFFVGSSVEAMERIIQNTVEKSSFHFVNGAFSQKAASIARELQKEVIIEEKDAGSGFDVHSVTLPQTTELIFITENDTSTGTIFPHEDIYYLHEKYPEKLIVVDLVSSAPYSRIDFSKIDIAFFSGQKGFGLPAGMSILVVSKRALLKAKTLQDRGTMIGTYHNFPTLEQNRESWQTPETPNVLVIYLLEKILDDMTRSGIEHIRHEIDRKAGMLYEFFEMEDRYDLFVKNKVIRSPSTLVIKVNGGSKALREKLALQGIIVGSGYGGDKDEHVRIANFPAHTVAQVEKLLDSLGKS